MASDNHPASMEIACPEDSSHVLLRNLQASTNARKILDVSPNETHSGDVSHDRSMQVGIETPGEREVKYVNVFFVRLLPRSIRA
jgi:hypothetical protein